SGASYLVASDFNNDGYADFAVSYGYDEELFLVQLNTGNGTFEDRGPTFPAENGNGAVYNGRAQLAADLDGDGWTDLLGGIPLLVHFGKGDGTFEAALLCRAGEEPVGGGPLKAADLNGDGLIDLVVGGTVLLSSTPPTSRCQFGSTYTYAPTGAGPV